MNILRVLSLRSNRTLLFTLAALSILSGARAQTVVFNDTFGGGSTINNTTPTPAVPTINQTAYQQISAKSFQPTSVASGHMQYGLPGTSSAATMIEALFTQYPVTLANANDYIELTYTFTAQAAMLDYPAASVFIGL